MIDPTNNEVRYVGVTHKKEATRLREHLSKARRGEKTHRSTWLRTLLAKGLRPTLAVIDRGLGPGWVEAEQMWIKHYREAGAQLVNATDGGEGTLGYVPSQETREKMRAHMKNRPPAPSPTPETRAKMAESQRQRFEWEQANGISRKGKKRSPEAAANISRALTGRKLSEEHRKKLSEVHQNPSEELREKWRQAVLKRPVEVRQAFASNQKGQPKSEEHRRKIGQSRIGKPRSEETKQKLRDAHMGKAQTDETKRKKSEAAKAFWAALTPEERSAKARGKKAVLWPGSPVLPWVGISRLPRFFSL